MTLRTVQKEVRYWWSFDLVGLIEDISTYDKLLEKLETAEACDMMELRINSPGGYVDVGMQLVRAIQSTKAHVLANITWYSASMASLIAMACDDLKMYDNTYLMFHTYTGGSWGKADDLIKNAVYSDRVLRLEFNRLCTPFLSEDELEKMHKGEDIYIFSDNRDVKKRIKRHYKNREEQEAK